MTDKNKTKHMNIHDAVYVLRWVYQSSPDIVSGSIHDTAARALNFPSLARGMAPTAEEVSNSNKNEVRVIVK